MSTVEGYDLHVYCDEPDCRNRGQFSGYTKTSAYRDAKEHGWRIHSTVNAPEGSMAGGKLAYCPNHKKR